MAKKKGDPGEGKPVKPPSWRAGMDFILMLGGAVAIALLIKAYAFDVYLIPSGSMETALHGRPDGGDRIFCSKLNYHFRDPKRWEVAVFEFPYESARRSDIYNVSEQYRGQNFVKRIVGLPGESLAIGKGDIWVRSGDTRSEYARLVKPDDVQRGMWQNVYAEDFSDLGPAELGVFWKLFGESGIALDKGGPLRLSPGADGVRLDYRPLVPAGPDLSRLVELPGIPDRYTLRQPVQFRCNARGADGADCGHVFVKTIQTQNMQARCPKCGVLLDETAVAFYHRRSGLPGVGRYAVDPRKAPQGEDTSPRQSEYLLVQDLRILADISLESEKSTFIATIREDNRFVHALFHGDGRVELSVNGEASKVEHRALAGIRPGKSHRVEFYMVEGTARVFVDSTEKAALESRVWNDKRPLPRNLVRTSGVSLSASGGNLAVGSIAIDRDICYYSGWEHEKGEKFAQVSSQGEVHINAASFLPMGDHCPSSYDARSWGPVPLNLLRGPAMLIWWPPERAGLIPSPN